MFLKQEKKKRERGKKQTNKKQNKNRQTNRSIIEPSRATKSTVKIFPQIYSSRATNESTNFIHHRF